MLGCIAVRDKLGMFNGVAHDMKLEQSIMRSGKSAGGTVGQSLRYDYVAEWQLIYHESLSISKAFHELVGVSVLKHSECQHHHFSASATNFMNVNMVKLLDFSVAQGNPFANSISSKLYNFITKQLVDRATADRLLNLFQNGQLSYKEFYEERFVRKTKKLIGGTISRRNMPAFTDILGSQKKHDKDIATGQRKMDVARERRNIIINTMSRYSL